MIRLLYDTTINGIRFGSGSMLNLDAVTENQLIAEADAELLNVALSATTPVILKQTHVAVTRNSDNATDTVEQALGTYTLPGGTMDENGRIEIEAYWSLTSSVNSKTLIIDFGGTAIGVAPLTTTSNYTLFRSVLNLGALNSQYSLNVNGYGGNNASTMTKDTSLDVVIDIECKWGANVLSENITLLGYLITYFPGV